MLLAAAAGCAGSALDEVFGPSGETLREVIRGLPPERQDDFARVEQRCTRCHTLNAVFAAHPRAGGWPDLVRAMARRPGAGIPPGEIPRLSGILEHLDSLRAAPRNGS